MKIWLLVHRAVIIAISVAVCLYLEQRFGWRAALMIWAAGMLITCLSTALLLHRQPMGSRSIVNRLAGYFLMWGYGVTSGKLTRMVAVSWIVWVLMGGAVIALAVTLPPTPEVHAVGMGFSSEIPAWAAPDGQHPPVSAATLITLKVLLFLSWLVLGWCVLYLIGVMVRNRRVNRPLVVPLLIVTGLIAVSAGIFFRSPSKATLTSALLLAGGPIAVIGGGYALFIGVFLIAGRKANFR